MNNDPDQAWQGHTPLSPLPATRRRWPWLILLIVLTLAGAGSVYAWPEIATLVPSLGHDAPGKGTPAPDAEALPDLLATQQKVANDLAALGRTVADQQQQLKSIADQLAAVTSKVDALQQAAPVPVSPPVAAEPPRAPIAHAPPRPRKPPSRTPTSSGPISTGGAPLTAKPGDTAH